MSRKVGDIYEEEGVTYEVISIDTQTLEDGSVMVIESAVSI